VATGGVTTTALPIGGLYRAHRGRVEFVDVPELAFVAVAGQGAPEGQAFAEAVRALYAVSHGAHFLLRKEFGVAPRVMPLEALWWVGEDEQPAVEAGTRGDAATADTDRRRWRWRALVMQPEPIEEELVAEAVARARANDLPALDRLTFDTWEEGRCAQLLHVGPYAAEAPSLRLLHEAIAQAHLRPRGRHHEVYLGDPRRSAPQHLRTILRQPVEPT
jgi:hypothetical protein